MSHSYVQNHLHAVFSTKEREKLIAKPIQTRSWSYMAGIARNHDFLVIANGGMEDHVHLLILAAADPAFGEGDQFIEGQLLEVDECHGTGFAWQQGYGAFAVSKSNIDAVVRYINEQERHHQKMSFEDEFIGLLKKHGMEYDPKYVFG